MVENSLSFSLFLIQLKQYKISSKDQPPNIQSGIQCNIWGGLDPPFIYQNSSKMHCQNTLESEHSYKRICGFFPHKRNHRNSESSGLLYKFQVHFLTFLNIEAMKMFHQSSARKCSNVRHISNSACLNGHCFQSLLLERNKPKLLYMFQFWFTCT